MNQLNSPYLKDALCHVWLKLAKCFGEVSPPPQKKTPTTKQTKTKQKQNKINPYVNLFLTISITKKTGPVNETKI